MTEHEKINNVMSRRELLRLSSIVGATALTMTACSPEAPSVSPSSNPIRSTPPVEAMPTPSPSEKSSTKRELAPKEWRYDFSTLPDGQPPADDWNFEHGVEVANYNNELQAYTPRPENVRIEHGVLVLEAHQESFMDKDFTSARINTLQKFEFTHGIIEVDMKVPRGNGTWPAAWLMPAHNIYNPDDYGIRAEDKFRWALNGEIDFAESIGSIPNQNIPGAHTYNQLNRGTIYTPAHIDNPYDEFHRYSVMKEPNKLTFMIDGVPYATREKKSDSPLEWPYEQPYYLILNLAVGGSWAGQKGIDTASAPWQMQVRSISYHDLT